jgi:hypothetical protein
MKEEIKKLLFDLDTSLTDDGRDIIARFISSNYISKDKVMEIAEKSFNSGFEQGEKLYTPDFKEYGQEIKKEYGL